MNNAAYITIVFPQRSELSFHLINVSIGIAQHRLFVVVVFEIITYKQYYRRCIIQYGEIKVNS